MPPVDAIAARRSARDAGRELAVVLALVSVVVALAFRATPARLSGALTPDLGDPVFNLVVLQWFDHQARSGFPDFWSASWFHPTPRALTLSDHLIGPGVAYFLLRRLGSTPIAAYNLLLLGSFVLGFATSYEIGRRLGLSRSAAVVAGSTVAFSAFRWSQLPHFQVLWAPWIPLLYWSWHRLVLRPTPRAAGAAVAAYLLQVTGGLYLAFLAHLPLAVLAAGAALSRAWRRWTGRGLASIAIVLALSAAAAAAVFGPYRAEAAERRRPEGEMRRFAGTLESFVTPAHFGRLRAPWPAGPGRPENELFPGVAPSLLAVAGLAFAFRGAGAPPDRRRAFAATLGAVLLASGLVLGDLKLRTGLSAIGPFRFASFEGPFRLAVVGLVLLAAGLAGRIRLTLGDDDERRSFWRFALATATASMLLCLATIYLPLSHRVPGLDALRVPTRTFAFALPVIGWLAGAGLDRLRARLAGRRRAALLAAALALCAADAVPRPLPWHPLPAQDAFPAVYRWLRDRPEILAYLELPLADLERPHLETRPMYFATAHWKPIVNGYSGHVPAFHRSLRARLSPLPSNATLLELRAAGVSALVVRRREMRGGERGARYAGWLAARRREGLEILYRDREAEVLGLAGLVATPEPTPPPELADRQSQRSRSKRRQSASPRRRSRRTSRGATA